MKFLKKCKDGGPESPVDGYSLVEIKGVFSIVILKFNKGMREKYHTHAFNALTWFIKGDLEEQDVNGTLYKYTKSIIPKFTSKGKNHRVLAKKDSWCISLRGPWERFWTEYDEELDVSYVLTNKRVVVASTEGVISYE